MAPERTIVVYGAGAVGGFLGWKLAETANVVLVGRTRLVNAVIEQGLLLREDGVVTARRVQAVDSIAGLAPVDLVLLTVRTFDVSAAIPDLRHLLSDRGMVVAWQNGVGTEEEIANELGRRRVVAGTLTVSVGMEQPGIVTRYSRSGGVVLAGLSGEPPPAWLSDYFQATGLPTVALADYHSLRWSKLLLNMLGAAQSAILDLDSAALTRHPQLFRIEQLASREIGRVMDAVGIRTVSLPGYPVPLARLAMRLPRPLAQGVLGPRLADARGGRSPTMRADMARGRTEVAAFHGAVAREARREGLRAPVNAALADLVEELARDPARREEFRGKPEKLVALMESRGIHL